MNYETKSKYENITGTASGRSYLSNGNAYNYVNGLTRTFWNSNLDLIQPFSGLHSGFDAVEGKIVFAEGRRRGMHVQWNLDTFNPT